MASVESEWSRKFISNPASSPPSSGQPQSIDQSVAESQSSSGRSDSQTPTNQPKTPGKSRHLVDSQSANIGGIPSPPSSTSPSQRQFSAHNPFSEQNNPRSSLDRKLSPPLTPEDAKEAVSSTLPPSYHSSPPSANQSNANHIPGLRSVDRPHRFLDETNKLSTAQSTQRRPYQPAGHTRHRSLQARFPGDMSHRPLDQIKRETRAAERAPHRRHRHRISNTDTIDNLDTIGGAYHHDGPYDATLVSRNLNMKYSPVAAVKDSNMEALRATPREYIEDSLQQHVPLQGTATIPDGGIDYSGNAMSYEEGADLMREPDAEGGAYKRWHGVQYHPDDLKGKGEPSYSIERDLKKGKKSERYGAYEMQPRTNMRLNGHQRRSSDVDGDSTGLSPNYRDEISTGLTGVHRSNSTGNRLTEGLKRRFDNIRRKKNLSIGGIE